MVSFLHLVDIMEEEQIALEDHGDPRAIATIRSGLNISPHFWDDFLKICNQPGLADLLGVRPEVIAGWSAKIRENLLHIQRLDGEEASQTKSSLVTTGY